MKIYAVADIHGAQHRMNIIQKNIELYHPDLVLICGDITQFGPGEQAQSFLDSLFVKTVAIPGNIDTADVYEAIQKSSALSLHRNHCIIKGYPFIGIGGDLGDCLQDLTILSNNSTKNIQECIDASTIVLTHVPPYGLQDKTCIGQHIGNKALRFLVDTKKPCLVVCGHVHENPGFTKYKTTVVVNCSMGKRTQGALITINKDIEVQILE